MTKKAQFFDLHQKSADRPPDDATNAQLLDRSIAAEAANHANWRMHMERLHVPSIISLAHSLRLQVIAEGVETAAQLSYLPRHDCDFIQGYFSAGRYRRPNSRR